MQFDPVFGLRNLIVFGVLFTTASLQPEASFALSRALRRIHSRLVCFRQSLRDALRTKGSSKFWEIDMTKFEP